MSLHKNHEGSMLLEINFTLILFAISFLIFIYLLNLTLYKPVGKIIEARKNLIDGQYAKAKELTGEANHILESYQNKIKRAKHEAHNIIEEVIQLGQKEKEGKINLLVDSLSKEKEITLKQIQDEKTNTMNKLQKELGALTELITSKVLGMEKDLVGTC